MENRTSFSHLNNSKNRQYSNFSNINNINTNQINSARISNSSVKSRRSPVCISRQFINSRPTLEQNSRSALEQNSRSALEQNTRSRLEQNSRSRLDQNTSSTMDDSRSTSDSRSTLDSMSTLGSRSTLNRNIPIIRSTENRSIDLNETTHYPSFAETLSNFQNIILEAERELSDSSLKTDIGLETIRSFEAKVNIPKLNSKIIRRKSVNVGFSKSRLCTQKSKNQLETSGSKNRLSSNSFKADSDDEKSKKKVLSSSIIEKRNKIGKQLNLDNASEHFTNLLRIRNENTLIKMVKMHLLILLDLDGENFSNVFEEESPSVKKSNTIKKKKQDYKSQDKGLFQQVLTEEGICRLYLLTDFIGTPKNINQEGIFRKCGSTVRQQELKYRLQNNIDLQLDTGKYTVHDCTNVLKTCLSEMPEPLLTDLFFKIITQKLASKETNNISKSFTELDFGKIFGDKNLKIIQLILLLIPMKRRKFANDLLTLLNKIASKENLTNRMDAKSLATLFAPHLLCPKSMTPADLQRYCTILTIQLEFMIKNVKLIFKTPAELTLDIRKELERMDNPNVNNEEDGINTVVTFCDRQATNTQNQTEQHIAELYAHIQSMPETPAKKRLIKQFNRQNGGLTPQMDKENSKKKHNKLKQIGDKLKNAKNLFKANSAVKNKRGDDENVLQSNLQQTDGFLKSSNEQTEQRVKEQNIKFNLPLSPIKQKETQLADLTVTKFCIDEEDTTQDLLYHKKLNDYSNDEIFSDYPYASESILL